MAEEFDRGDRLGELLRSLQEGDLEGSVMAAREITTVPLTEKMMWAIIAIFFLNAVSKLVFRATPLAKPVVDNIVEKDRERFDEKMQRERIERKYYED